jgi:hypothetical protein
MKAVSASDAAAPREWTSDDGGYHRLTEYFGDVQQLLDGPQGFLVEHFPGPDVGDDTAIVSHPHYHRVRQFQLVVHGDRPMFGRRELEPFAFHYTDPSTPYGPIWAGKGGVGYFTLRAKADVGSYKMPGEKERMLVSPRRNIAVQVGRAPLPAEGAQVETLIEQHDDGLASYYLRLAAGTEITAPAGEGGGGQYHVVLEGSAASDGAALPTRSLVWVGPGEPAPTFAAGGEGAEVIVLQFPVPGPGTEVADPDAPGQ